MARIRSMPPDTSKAPRTPGDAASPPPDMPPPPEAPLVVPPEVARASGLLPALGDHTPEGPPDDAMITPICAIFRRFLKRQGLKFTWERAQTLDVVLGKEGVFEADELIDEIKAAGHRVSRATIYRTLKHLKEAGIVREVLLDSNKAHFALSFGKAAKGHLVCVETHRIVEFPSDELDALMRRVCAEQGFDPVSHRFVIYGVSPEARAAEQAEADEQD